jgi:hypothetical protein
MAAVTSADAEVILRLYELRRETELRKAREWFVFRFEAPTYADFERQCPRGSDENRYYRMVTSYWEMAAALVLQGAVADHLFFETSGELMAVWRKVKPWIADLRAARGNPRQLHNLEEIAGRYERYLAAATR